MSIMMAANTVKPTAQPLTSSRSLIVGPSSHACSVGTTVPPAQTLDLICLG